MNHSDHVSAREPLISSPTSDPSRAPLPPRAAASLRSRVAMNEATRDGSADVYKGPKAGWTLTLNGGIRTVEDVYAAQKKAAKGYQPKDELGSDVVRYQKGWTTN